MGTIGINMPKIPKHTKEGPTLLYNGGERPLAERKGKGKTH